VDGNERGDWNGGLLSTEELLALNGYQKRCVIDAKNRLRTRQLRSPGNEEQIGFATPHRLSTVAIHVARPAITTPRPVKKKTLRAKNVQQYYFSLSLFVVSSVKNAGCILW
jgi:hypothetical protein